MKKLFSRLVVAFAGMAGVATAQQDPQFTQFMYNKLIFNPGYAGTSGAVCGVLQFRQQWAGFAGAPQSIALAGDMRLQGLPIGVGINIISDKIGPMNTTFARIAGSFNLTKLAGGTLGVGLDFGILQKKINEDWITPEPLKDDPRIPGMLNNPDLNKASIDLGLGVFYQIPGKFYAGVSSTHLPAQNIKEGDINFKVTRHIYFMTGYTLQLNKWSKLTPNILYKTDLNANSTDLNLTYLWSDMVWLGGTYRIKDAAAVMVGYQGKALSGNTLTYRIGYSYEFTTNALKSYNNGSHEIIIGACFAPKIKKPTTYGDPRFLD